MPNFIVTWLQLSAVNSCSAFLLSIKQPLVPLFSFCRGARLLHPSHLPALVWVQQPEMSPGSALSHSPCFTGVGLPPGTGQPAGPSTSASAVTQCYNPYCHVLIPSQSARQNPEAMPRHRSRFKSIFVKVKTHFGLRCAQAVDTLASVSNGAVEGTLQKLLAAWTCNSFPSDRSG